MVPLVQSNDILESSSRLEKSHLVEDELEGTIQGQLENMMSIIREGFQSLQLSIEKIHSQLNRQEDKINRISSMITTMDAYHLASL